MLKFKNLFSKLKTADAIDPLPARDDPILLELGDQKLRMINGEWKIESTTTNSSSSSAAVSTSTSNFIQTAAQQQKQLEQQLSNLVPKAELERAKKRMDALEEENRLLRFKEQILIDMVKRKKKKKAKFKRAQCVNSLSFFFFLLPPPPWFESNSSLLKLWTRINWSKNSSNSNKNINNNKILLLRWKNRVWKSNPHPPHHRAVNQSKWNQVLTKMTKMKMTMKILEEVMTLFKPFHQRARKSNRSQSLFLPPQQVQENHRPKNWWNKQTVFFFFSFLFFQFNPLVRTDPSSKQASRIVKVFSSSKKLAGKDSASMIPMTLPFDKIGTQISELTLASQT